MFVACAPAPRPLQALSLGKPGSECCAVPDATHWTFAELEAQASMPPCCACFASSTWRLCLAGCELPGWPTWQLHVHACLPVLPEPCRFSSNPAHPAPLQLSGLSSGIDMVRREQELAGPGGEARQLGALAGQASAVQQRGQQLLAAARHKAADTLRFLGEDVPGEPGFSASEPRRMLTDVRDFFALLHKAHADGKRMEVCVATLAAQRAEEEAEAEAARRAAAEAAVAEAAAAEAATDDAEAHAVEVAAEPLADEGAEAEAASEVHAVAAACS